MDDYGLILNDTKIHSIKYLHYQFIPDKEIALNIENNAAACYYRPFAHILPMIGWLLFGKNVLGYHIMNLLLFYGAIIALYYLINSLFSNKPLARLSCLLFAVHPLNGLFINYITASVFALQILALSFAFILFWKACEKKQWILLMSGSLLCYIIGLFCHETSFALPLYLTASLYLLKKPFQKKYIYRLIPYYLFSIVYFIFRIQFASLNNSLINKLQLSNISLFQFVTSNIKLFIYYLSRFFYFDGIAIKFSMPPVTTNGFLWIILLGLVSIILIYWAHKKQTLKLWGATIFIIGFTPTILGSSFELQYGFMFEPHWMFFPSFGLFMIAGTYLLEFQKQLKPSIFFVIISVIILNMLIYSRQMNKLWSDEIAYCRYWLKHSPQQNGAKFYLAAALEKNGQLKEAKEAYYQAIEGRFFDWQIYVNLSLIAQKEGDNEKSLFYLEKALEIFPHSAVINNNMGTFYKNTTEYTQAKKYFYQALKYNPFLLEPRLNLASIFNQEGDFIIAEKLYIENLAIKPFDEESLKDLLHCYILSTQKEKIIKLVDQCLQHIFSPDFYINTSSLLAENNYPKLSFLILNKALIQYPTNVEIIITFGKFLANMNKFQDAINIWQQALKLGGNKTLINDLIHKAQQLNMTTN